jgi:hypothetical protein
MPVEATTTRKDRKLARSPAGLLRTREHTLERCDGLPHDRELIRGKLRVPLRRVTLAEELHDIDAETLGDPSERIERRTLLRPFDFTDELVGQAGLGTQFFLAPSSRRPEFDEA